MIKKLKGNIKCSKLYIIIRRLWIVIFPTIHIKKCYRSIFGKEPRITNPLNLIEKIYWLQLNTDTTMWTLCADKYLMRNYVKDCGYQNYLPKLFAVYDIYDKIQYEVLPNEFIIKANNGCGCCYIVHNKCNEHFDKIQSIINSWFKCPYGYEGAQFHYTRIKPKIIVEELLKNDEFQSVISPNSLIDYKVWCINGNPENILIVYDRKGVNGEFYCLELYDINWYKLTNKLIFNGHFEYRDISIPQPKCLSEMLSIAKALSAPFPEVRVDFYIVNNKPIVGELTFTTGYGYFTEDYYIELGKKIDISKLKKISHYENMCRRK